MLSNAKLLTNEELSMLLSSKTNADDKPLTSLFLSSKDTEEQQKIATTINQELLRKYRIDAEIVPNGILQTEAQIKFVVHYDAMTAQIITPANFAASIINMALGNKNLSPEDFFLATSANVSVLQNIVNTIAYAVLPIIAPQSSTCRVTLENNPEPFSASGMAFTLSSGATFLLQYPIYKKEENSHNFQTSELNDIFPLELTAIMAETTTSIKDLANWKKGTLIPLSVEKNNEISILCGKQKLLRGKLGQQFHKIAVKITQKEC